MCEYGGNMKNFGIRLKRLREKRGLSIEALGKIANCHYCMVRDWENGKRTLTVSKLINLAQYFGVSIDYLVGL